jgi:hypothetical protein
MQPAGYRRKQAACRVHSEACRIHDADLQDTYEAGSMQHAARKVQGTK